MAAASNEETKSENNNNNNNNNDDDEVNEVDIITVGRFVEVASRTWPGINKPGGVARVVEVHFDASSDDETNDNDNDNEKDQGVRGNRKHPTHVNVRYVVGNSREKRVPVEYVQLAPQYETHRSTTKDSSASTSAGGDGSGGGSGNGNRSYAASSLRDRSMLLGRCRRCGSLRTDCGSCDWAMEEEAALSANFAENNKKTTISKKSSALAKMRKKDKRRNKSVDSFLFDDDSDDSSLSNNDEDDGDGDDDDDDDDMTRLRKLIHETQRRRKHSKNEEKFSNPSLDGNNDTSSIMAGKEGKSRLQLQKYRKSTAKSKWRRRYPVLIDDCSSSSDSSDSEIEESHHSKSMRKSRETNSRRRNRRHLTGGKSILEDLPAMRAGASNEKQPKIKRSSLSASAPTPKISRQQRRQTSHTLESLQLLSSSDSDSDNIPLSSVGDLRRHNKTSSSKRNRSGETSSDIPLNTASSNATRSATGMVVQRASYDQQLLELEARARFQMEQQQQNSSAFPSAAVGGNDDAGFIQPEGQEAVENLPEDMVDLSKSVPYKDLGSFFDSMATRIEDEMLPDLKLKMAGLHHRLRTLQNKQGAMRNRMDNTPNTADTTPASAKQLLEEYHRLWEEVCLSIIQNGTDQCRATLRRLMDDKLYKKHRKKLTAAQRKRCRGPGIMDARNLRMDAMDYVVEAFVRKLKDAVVTCETECVEIDSVDIGTEKDGDDGNSAGGDIYYDDDTSSGEDDNLDFLPMTAMANNDRVGNKLAPFDPHEHASRVTKEKPSHETMQSKKYLPSASRTKSSKNPSRKRQRTSNLNATKVDDRSTTGSSLRSAIQVDTNDVEQEGKLRNTDESTVVMSDAEDPSIDPVEKAFETDGAFTSIHNNTMVGAKTMRKRKSRSRNPQPRFAEPRDQKQSISERMQAFLDANVGNGMKICSEGEETEVELIHRGQERNNHRQKRRQLSIFEPRTKQKGVQNDESPIGAQAGIEEQGENEEEREETQLTSYDTNALFLQLSDRTRLSEEFAETLMNGDSSNLDKNWEGLLSEMEIALSNNPESMNLFLQKAYNMLVSHGSRTIQDMIASKEAELSLHIRTLSLCVRSLKFISNDKLPIIFAKERQECFLDFLVLQMVDSLYSSSLPSAWALGIENCERVIHKLIPLRNALASRIPLVEAVSRCVIKSLECQQWRKSQYKNHIFVSSLDPNCWSDFLQTGKQFDDPQVTRFQKLGRVWPRIEVDALWRILAFVGVAPSISTDKSVFRLQIVSKLFSSGVLAVATVGKEEKLPPSKDQLLACQQEIRYFSSLIGKGALDSLPKTDSMLVKLMQHTLQLQLESFEGNDYARASCFPSSSDDVVAKKTSPMFWRTTHPLYFNSKKVNCRYVSITDFPFNHLYGKNEKTYKMLLYPTSDLLLSCLSLLTNWVNQVSNKKIRQNRLANSLKALQNDLLKKVSKYSEQPVKKADVSFEDAFSVKPSIEVGIGSERATIFKLEAASYIQIFGSICMKNKTDPDLSQSVWKSISDDQMKKRQCDIIRLHRNIDECTGDAYLLFAAAKVMATTLLLQMNVSPWHLSFGISVTKVFAENSQPEIESFSFPLSCIFACLDCLCDLEVGPQVFSQLYEIIILIFRNLAAMIMRGERNLASDHLKSNCVLNFNPVLMKCIKMHLVSSRGSHESFHLRLCLSSIRAIHTFVAVHHHDTEVPSANDAEPTVDQSQNMANDVNGEDMWGDLDDSDLAGLDLGGIPEGQNEVQQREQLWELLSDALEQSKPSKRFAILRSTPDVISGSSFHISSIGKYLIADEVNKICDCFSTAIASIEVQGTIPSELTKLVAKWSQPSYDDDEDSQYGSKIARKLTSELCSLSEKYPMCRNFVSEHANNMLFNFLKALMDSSRLEKLPSCNLERIGESSGRSGTDQAVLLLDLFNDDSFQDINDQHQGSALSKLQTRRRKSAIEIWDFCFKLGTSFAKNDSPDSASLTTVGNALLNLDSDLLQEFNFLDDVISLENETFKTFRLLRNIVSYSAVNDASFATFEKISSCSLLLLANHILSIVQSLKYNDRTSSDREYKKARLTELLTSFVELFVSSAAWILQEGAKNKSKAWSFLQNYLRDRLFSPILRNQPIDTTIALQEVIVAARFVHAGPHGEGVSLPPINCAGLVGCSKYLGGCFLTSVLRRSRQLLVATALNPQNLGLQNAIFEAVLGSSDDLEDAAPWIVGTEFPLGKRQSMIRSRFVWPYSSPLQKQIDEYLQFVDENLPLSKRMDGDEWWNSMAIMKKSFLKNHVIPRLHSNSLAMEKKRRIIMLLSYILEYDVQSSTSAIPDDDKSRERTIDVHIAREIIKALRSNLHKCLMQFSVDNTVARAIFLCSMHLANSYLLLDDKTQNLVSWSRTKMLGTKGKTILDLTNSEVLGSYVWIFFQWLRTLGDIVVDRNGDGDLDSGSTSETLASMRKYWRETQCCRFGGLDEERLDLECSNAFETWDRLLIDFEDLAFPSKKSKNQKNIVVNIYAKPSIPDPQEQHSNSKSSSSLFDPWKPSIAMKKSLKEVMAVILTTS